MIDGDLLEAREPVTTKTVPTALESVGWREGIILPLSRASSAPRHSTLPVHQLRVHIPVGRRGPGFVIDTLQYAPGQSFFSFRTVRRVML